MDTALCKHSLVTWSLVFLLLQAHWRLDFKVKLASDSSLLLSIWMYLSSTNSHYIHLI